MPGSEHYGEERGVRLPCPTLLQETFSFEDTLPMWLILYEGGLESFVKNCEE